MPPLWRLYVNDEVQSSDDATWRKELPNRGALHTVLLRARCTNGATSGRGVSIFDAIDDITIIGDGSEVLFSLKPTELEKWYETLYGRPLDMVQNEEADAVQEVTFPILFGRQLYDPDYFLRLNAFTDVKVEVKYSPTIAADGGFASGSTTFNLELLMTQEEGELAYKGTLVTRRIKSFTSASSGEEEVELPDGKIIRHIGVYAYEAGVADGTDITKVELKDVATGTTLFEADWDDFLTLNRESFGSIVEHNFTVFLQDNETLNTRIGKIMGWSLVPKTAPNLTDDTFVVARIDAVSGDQVTFALAQADITAGGEDLTSLTSDKTYYLKVWGKSPSYFGLIPFGYKEEDRFYFRTAEHGKPVVVLSQGGAGAEVNVSIQELRSF